NDLSKGYKNAAELGEVDNNGQTGWDVILGDPANYVPPLDAHMIASILPRPGLPPPGSMPGADPYNGHEYTISKNDDLQYACIFPLPVPRDCSQLLVSCDCQNPINDNPLCDPGNPMLQVNAKAYPGIRQLNVLKALGAQGVVSSICPSQQDDPTKADYAYRPAVRAL